MLPGVSDEPELRFFVDGVDAALASLAGDVEGSLRTIEKMSFEGVPQIVREIIVRLHSTMLVLAGRAEEAVSVAGPLLDSPHAYVRSVPAMVRWLAGDPRDYLANPPAEAPAPDDSYLYRFVASSHAAGVASSLGDHATAGRVRPEFEAALGTRLDARESAIATIGLACCMVLDHDEDGAAAVIDGHVTRHPLDDPRGEARLRRNLPIAYVTSARAREHWDAADLGPAHRRARTVAGCLLAAREGRLGRHAELGSSSTILTNLPLPWSVELGVRACAAGIPDGEPLLRTLMAWLPAATRREVEWLSIHGDHQCRDQARAFLDEVRELTQAPLRVDVLGPLRLWEGNDAVTGPALRRGRVRTLLSLLVLRGPMRRGRICDLLWPDLDPPAAAQNLRVTLSRLRSLLEPDRVGGRSRIRSETDVIELAGPPLVVTDLGRLRTLLADADRARSAGDATAELTSLDEAVALWTGDPLEDLASIDELVGEVEYVHRSLVEGCLRLGELLLVAGRYDDSLRCAERGRVASPFSERAHRLAIACHLQRQDNAGLASAVEATNRILAELDVEAEPATAMLVRRAAGRLGG